MPMLVSTLSPDCNDINPIEFNKRTNAFLDYVATHPDAVLKFKGGRFKNVKSAKKVVFYIDFGSRHLYPEPPKAKLIIPRVCACVYV